MKKRFVCFRTKWMPVIALALALCISSVSAFADSWKFAVMSDTQWTNSADAANNPATVAVGIINQLNKQFIAHGVKFVLQVGDLDDKETDYSGNQRLGILTRAAAAQALYDAGIGFFPVRGNHEGSSTAAAEVQTYFPQTQAAGPYTFGATNFSSPSANLNGLSYSFDYNNTRFVLLDQFTPTDGKASDGAAYSQGNNAISSQQSWISSTLSSKPAGAHAFVFSHKQLFGGNHTDTLFNTAAGNTTKQNDFIGSLDANNVGYLFSGHDHMHNLSIVTSPDGNSKIRQVICASDSYKFYTPVSLANHGTDPADTGYPNAGLISKNREKEISQELWSTGYYIVTVDGPNATVDFYSADPTPAVSGLEDVDLKTTPALTFTKRETFGYSLNGQEYLVAQGQPYTVVNETYNGATAAILSGSNNSTNKDYNSRPLVKAVNTGWAPVEAGNAVNTFSILGMADGLSNSIPYEERGTTSTDTFTLSMTYDPAAVVGDPLSGNFGLVVKDANYGWVNAVSKNFGGAINFVVGPWDSGYGLGTYGVDPGAHTAWAVINHNSDFSVGPMNAGNAAPVVAIVSPSENQIFDAPASVTVAADAFDSNGSITKVDFYIGATKIGESLTPPYSATWSGIPSGSYALKAVATDNEGMKTISPLVDIMVNNLDNELPVVALTSPVNGSTAFAGNVFVLSATASDTDGYLAKVEFYAGMTKIGEDTTAPFNFGWTASAVGDYTLTAVAIDNDNGQTISNSISVSVAPIPQGTFFENFNSMGTAGTTPPAGWSLKNANGGGNSTWLDSTGIFAGGTTSVATMVDAAGNLTAVTTPSGNNNNGYNAAAAGIADDRMLATAPTGNAGSAIQLQLTNNSNSGVNRLLIGYDIYRINAPASVNELPGFQFFYSIDNGSSWTNVQPLNPSVGGPNGVIAPNTIGVTNVTPTPVALSNNWNAGNSILFRWVDDNGVPTSPDQMYGLDNVFIRAAASLNLNAATSGFVYSRATKTYSGALILTNAGQDAIRDKFFVSLANLTSGVVLLNASGSDNMSPFLALTLAQPLNPGESVAIPISLNNPSNAKISFSAIAYQ